MIDRVRGLVLSILKKENKGWITPEDFNRFADLSQLEIFEEYFYEYNTWLNKKSGRMTHDGYGDIPELIAEKIAVFLKTDSMTYEGGLFSPPADNYRLETVYYGNRPVEEVRDHKVRYMLDSILIEPTTTYPVYIRIGSNIKIYPTTITSGVDCFYLRRPAIPKWTYTAVAGNPVFNIGAADYQDFEIHPADEIELVYRILKKAGVSIREEQIIQYVQMKEQEQLQKES